MKSDSTTARELCVVIPTRERWGILPRTLAALAGQTVSGFEIVVVVDGRDQVLPDLSPARVVVQERAGPGAARNRGVELTTRPLVLFLGDDMIPTPHFVERHLSVHADNPDPQVAVLGHVDWHPDVPRNHVVRWLEWSGTQFDYPNIVGRDAGWGRFYSSNVSVKRRFFLDAGGFDEAFGFDYEDLDLAFRLHENGLRLLYEPDALVHHLHPYDFERLQTRYNSRAEAEQLMLKKHEWFSPYFANKIRAATRAHPVSPIWPRIVEHIPAWAGGLRRLARRKTDTWFHQKLAAGFISSWQGYRDHEELKAYLGDEYDEALLWRHESAVERELHELADEATFYRASRMYLYDLTAFAMSGTKAPYLADLRRLVPTGARLLDWGCGIGSDGLRLIEAGYSVSFADFDNPSTRYLRWRLQRRGLTADVYDLDRQDVPDGFDAAYAFDVLEHVEDPFATLAELERRAKMVIVNLLEPDPTERLHRALPVSAILDRAHARGIIRHRKYHGRSHLVAYRGRAAEREHFTRVRSTAERRLGGFLAR